MLNEIIKDINETLKFAKALDLDIIELGKKKGIDLSEAFNKDGTINEDSDVYIESPIISCMQAMNLSKETLRTTFFGVIIKLLRDESNNHREKTLNRTICSGKLDDASQVARLMFETSVKQQGPEPIKIYEDCLDTVSRSYEIGKIVNKDKVKEEEFINVFYFNQVVVIMTLVVGMLINTVFCKHEEALEIQNRLINIEKEIAK